MSEDELCEESSAKRRKLSNSSVTDHPEFSNNDLQSELETSIEVTSLENEVKQIENEPENKEEQIQNENKSEKEEQNVNENEFEQIRDEHESDSEVDLFDEDRSIDHDIVKEREDTTCTTETEKRKLQETEKEVASNNTINLSSLTGVTEQHFGALTDLQQDLQKLIASDNGDSTASMMKIKQELFSPEELSPTSMMNSDNFDPSRIQLAAESFRNICMTLARAKHLNETREIKMDLSNKELWEKFHLVGNEMIITRSGRRLFPKLSCSVTGLKPSAQYVLLVDIVPADNRRYRYCSQQEKWVGAGHARHDPPKQVYIHPASPQTGEHWMDGEISFHKLKVQTSNFYEEYSGHTVLNSQHRYQPRVHVVQCNDIYRVPQCPFKTFIFPETAFFAVTTYQSTNITEMKIANNPFAKGFRAPGTATQAAGDRHEAKGTENIVIELDSYGAPPFLAAGGAIKHTACGKSPKTESGLAPSMLSSAAKPGSRYQQPHSKPNPNWVYSGSGHRPTMITAQPLFQNQMRSGGNIQMNHVPGHPQMVSGPHRYPVSSMPVSSEYPIQRIMRPVYGAAPAGAGAVPVQMSGVPSGNLVHWGYNSQPHYRPQAGMVPVPQSIPVPSPGPNPPLPSSPQVVNVPDSTQDKEMTTPVKESPVRSPTANSANSSPSADATIKVRLAGSEDFFEVELVDIGDSYNSLVTCFAEELDVKSETVAKIRKLPNILIRKDRDVKRIKNGSEFEVELNPES